MTFANNHAHTDVHREQLDSYAVMIDYETVLCSDVIMPDMHLFTMYIHMFHCKHQLQNSDSDTIRYHDYNNSRQQISQLLQQT